MAMVEDHGAALGELTFHQRAALLKSLGQLLREHRQELYALSARTGATLGDSKFDVDGGDFATIIHSIDTSLFTLPPETMRELVPRAERLRERFVHDETRPVVPA